MANPQIQQVVQKVDEFLAGYPTLFQYGASTTNLAVFRTMAG